MRRAILVLALICLADDWAAAQELRATRTLRPGTILTAADIEPGQGGAAARDSVIGLEVRRAIYAGRPVSEADLGPPTLVERNAVVTMIFRSEGLGIRTEGRALDRGGAGERIRVMNLESRLTVSATVIGPDRVEVAR